jgi:hypothetical protein
MRLLALLVVLLPLCSPPVPAHAQESRTEPVVFAPGASGATLRGRITGDQTVLYEVGAEAGQQIAINLDAANVATYFNVYAPGAGPGDPALATSGMTGALVPDINRVLATLPATGVYGISVYLLRAAARRNETADYRLEIAVRGDLPAAGQGDFADGLRGGSDLWRVATQSGGLNLRAAPSSGASRVGTLEDGHLVRAVGGCRMVEGRRWCRIATPDASLSGWVAGEFLIEAAPQEADGDWTWSAGSLASAPRTEVRRVDFGPGTSQSEKTGRLGPGEAVSYVLEGREGDLLTVRLEPEVGETRFSIFVPGGALLFESLAPAREPDAYRGQLYRSGPHQVTIANAGTAASEFAVSFSLE